MPEVGQGLGWLDLLSIMNTIIGIENMAKNDAQYEHQHETEDKIDQILSKVIQIERRLNDANL